MIFATNTMNLNFCDAVCYLTFMGLEKYDFIKHAFTTRIGGISKNEFKSMNLSFSSGDDYNLVMENYRSMFNALNFNMNRLVRLKQTHGKSIKKILLSDVEDKEFDDRVFEGFDGLITNEKNIVLQTSHADCPAIFMLDPVKKVIGLAHAGWKGTVAGIAAELVQIFVSEYDSSVADIVCAIGPGIGKCCFEFSKYDLKKFETWNLSNFYKQSSKDLDKVYLDILEVNKQILEKNGILSGNIFKSDVCSKCNYDFLFSHRATSGKRGGNVAFMCLV